jgi:hypothetical protein
LVAQRYVQYHAVIAEVGAASDPDDPRLGDYATGAVLATFAAPTPRAARRGGVCTAKRSRTSRGSRSPTAKPRCGTVWTTPRRD